FEVQNYLSLSEHFYYPRQYIASENWWQTLDEEHQEILAQAAVEASNIQRNSLVEYELKMRSVLEENGMQINEVEKGAFIETAFEKIYPNFYTTLGGGDASRGEELIR